MREQGITFGIFVLIYQIAVMIIVGLLIGYDRVFEFGNFKIYDNGMYAMIATALILLLVGFGLMSSYIFRSSLSGIGFTLLIFALTLQHYILWSTFWYKTGLFDNTNSYGSFNKGPFYEQVVPSNFGIDRSQTQTQRSISIIDAIACSISVFIGLLPVIGRIGIFDVFWLTVIGTIFFQANNGLIWRFTIFDIGYGMRIFIYGSFMGLFSAIILGKRDTTRNHPNFSTKYPIQSLSLLGAVFVWCSFVFLQAANLYTQANNLLFMFAATLNMWLGLAAGVLGAFTASAFAYKKIHVYDIIFSAISGGIIFSCSGNLVFNPSVPISSGFIGGFFTSLYNHSINKLLNKNGVFFSLSLIQHILLPSMLGGFLSSTVAAIDKSSHNESQLATVLTSRDPSSNGAMQLLGMAFSLCIGSLSGIIIGVFYKFFSNNGKDDQFNDSSNYILQQQHSNEQQNYRSQY